MTLTFVDIYNAVAEQAWSMYDADAETVEDFESGLKTSINKALAELWCSYPFPFRVKNYNFTTVANQKEYDMPNGIIMKKAVDGEQTYAIRIDKNYLTLKDNLEIQDDSYGKPENFEVYNDTLLLYPIPDDEYEVKSEYLELAIGEDDFGDKIYELTNDEDTIDVTEKFEKLFKNALITKSMVYAITSKDDENYAGYQEQYENAYKTLLNYCIGLEKDKRVIV